MEKNLNRNVAEADSIERIYGWVGKIRSKQTTRELTSASRFPSCSLLRFLYGLLCIFSNLPYPPSIPLSTTYPSVLHFTYILHFFSIIPFNVILLSLFSLLSRSFLSFTSRSILPNNCFPFSSYTPPPFLRPYIFFIRPTPYCPIAYSFPLRIFFHPSLRLLSFLLPPSFLRCPTFLPSLLSSLKPIPCSPIAYSFPP